jgi:hypothetical protein
VRIALVQPTGTVQSDQLVVLSPPADYAFNSRFDRQSKDRRGFLDPTGRTNRVFRNDDHKVRPVAFP